MAEQPASPSAEAEANGTAPDSVPPARLSSGRVLRIDGGPELAAELARWQTTSTVAVGARAPDGPWLAVATARTQRSDQHRRRAGRRGRADRCGGRAGHRRCSGRHDAPIPRGRRHRTSPGTLAAGQHRRRIRSPPRPGMPRFPAPAGPRGRAAAHRRRADGAPCTRRAATRSPGTGVAHPTGHPGPRARRPRRQAAGRVRVAGGERAGRGRGAADRARRRRRSTRPCTTWSTPSRPRTRSSATPSPARCARAGPTGTRSWCRPGSSSTPRPRGSGGRTMVRADRRAPAAATSIPAGCGSSIGCAPGSRRRPPGPVATTCCSSSTTGRADATAPIRACVVGATKVGKSRLLNALVGHPLLSPVGVDITTSCWLEVGYGESATAEVIMANPDSPANPIRHPLRAGRPGAVRRAGPVHGTGDRGPGAAAGTRRCATCCSSTPPGSTVWCRAHRDDARRAAHGGRAAVRLRLRAADPRARARLPGRGRPPGADSGGRGDQARPQPGVRRGSSRTPGSGSPQTRGLGDVPVLAVAAPLADLAAETADPRRSGQLREPVGHRAAARHPAPLQLHRRRAGPVRERGPGARRGVPRAGRPHRRDRRGPRRQRRARKAAAAGDRPSCAAVVDDTAPLGRAGP